MKKIINFFKDLFFESSQLTNQKEGISLTGQTPLCVESFPHNCYTDFEESANIPADKKHCAGHWQIVSVDGSTWIATCQRHARYIDNVKYARGRPTVSREEFEKQVADFYMR